MTLTAYTLAVLLDLLVLFVGARFLCFPRAAASGYGVASTSGSPTAHPRIKGLRDSG